MSTWNTTKTGNRNTCDLCFHSILLQHLALNISLITRVYLTLTIWYGLLLGTSSSVNLKSVNVTLGEYSLKKKDEGTEVLMNLKKIHLHPNYNPVSKQNDIALIKITKSISVAPNIVPACLPGNSDNAMWETNTKATVLGWGKTTHDQDCKGIF